MENWELLQHLEAKEDLFKKYDIQQKVLEHRRLNNYKKYSDAVIKFNELTKLKNISIINGTKDKQINELNLDIAKYKALINTVSANIRKISETYNSKKNSFDSRAATIKDRNEYSDKLDFLNTYIKVINCKSGIPSIVLKDTALIITEKCNNILQRITDFTIDISIA